jgi:Ca2+/Na+ antiporter
VETEETLSVLFARNLFLIMLNTDYIQNVTQRNIIEFMVKQQKKEFKLRKDIMFTLIYIVLIVNLFPAFGFTNQQLGIVLIAYAIYGWAITYLQEKEEEDERHNNKRDR